VFVLFEAVGPAVVAGATVPPAGVFVFFGVGFLEVEMSVGLILGVRAKSVVVDGVIGEAS
jgi:hypothetical protein